MNLRQLSILAVSSFDEHVEAHDLILWIAVASATMQGSTLPKDDCALDRLH